ncbi:MAG: AAA family ATPase [Gammaproteobacteria bacterium]|nr:AAA family ATPase [Gammaproteobacteria bacterium]
MSAQIIETHISWVILTKKYAYKIKKPVDFGFLDFSTLAKRKYYCEEEIRINKIYAPDLYVKVIGYTVKDKVIDYAIVMNQFDQQNLFLSLLKSHELKPEYLANLAQQLAAIHQQAEMAPGTFGSPENIFFPVQQNFDQIRPFLQKLNNQKLLDQLNHCEKWAQEQYKILLPVLKSRKNKKNIRACHGDLHLGNIVLYHNKPMMFDAIEFNDNLRFTDTMADVGFLLMDLDEKNQSALGNVFLNEYLTLTGDYEGLKILRFYQAYRAVVRAKIKLFETNISWSEYETSMNLAEKYTESQKPELFIMHGISGSGKSTRAKQLASKLNAIHLRSDVERQRLSIDKTERYSEVSNKKVYNQLYSLTKDLLEAGYSMVVDATFLKKAQRDLFRQLSFPFHIVPCDVDDKMRETWLRDRSQDYSEADFTIAQQQREALEPLTLEERNYIYA